MDVSRRRVLSLLGAGFYTLSGCLAVDGSGSDSIPATETTRVTTGPATRTTRESVRLPVGSAYEAGGRSITVGNARVQESIEEFTGAWVQLATVPHSQFVVVDVRTGGAELPRSNEFIVQVDGQPTTADRTYVVSDDRSNESSETYAFPVEIDPAPESVEVVWEPKQVRWEIGSGVVDEIPNAPQFEVRSFSAPAETERGTDVTLSVTVANVGEANGTFRAELGPTSYSHVGIIAVDIPRGETVTYEDSFKGYLEDESAVSYYLDWGEDGLVRTVDVIEPPTETNTAAETRARTRDLK